MGKVVRVKKGNELLEIDSNDLPFAIKDGYLPTQRIIVANSKTKESFEIEPADYPNAIKDGFSFQDIVPEKKKNGVPPSLVTPSTLPPTKQPSLSFSEFKPVDFKGELPVVSPEKIQQFEDLGYKQRATVRESENKNGMPSVSSLASNYASQAFGPLLDVMGVTKDGTTVAKTEAIIGSAIGYREREKQLENEKAKVIEELTPQVDKAIEGIIGGYTTKDGQLNELAIYDKAGKIAEQLGGGSMFKEFVAQRIKLHESINILKPEAEAIANAKFKKKYGKSIDAFEKELGTKIDKEAEAALAYAKTEFANNQKQGQQIVSEKSKEIFNTEFKPLLEQAVKNKDKQAYEDLVKQYNSKLKAFVSAENARLTRLNKEVSAGYEKSISKLKETATAEQKKVLDEINTFYRQGFSEASINKMKLQGAIQGAIESTPSGASFLGGKALVEGYNLALANMGSGLVSLGFNNGFTDWMRGAKETAERYKTIDPELSTFMDYLNPSAYSVRLGRQLGQQAIGMAGMATGNVWASALAGMVTETSQNSGQTYEEVMSATGDPAKAMIAGQRVMAEGLADFPLYVADSFLDLSLLKGLGGFKKAGAAMLAELPIEITQELRQGYSQYKAAGGTQTEEEWLDEHSAEIAKETGIITLLQSGGFGAMGKAVESLNKKNIGNYNQNLFSMTLNKGEQFAVAAAEAANLNGLLSDVELANTKSLIGSVSQEIEELRKRGFPKEKIEAYTSVVAEIAATRSLINESTGEFTTKALEEKAAKLEKEAKDILNGEGTMVRIIMPNGKVVSIPSINAQQTITELKEEIGNGIVTVQVEGETKEAEKIKEQLDTIPVVVPKPETKPTRRVPKLTLTPESENLQKVSESDALSKESPAETQTQKPIVAETQETAIKGEDIVPEKVQEEGVGVGGDVEIGTTDNTNTILEKAEKKGGIYSELAKAIKGFLGNVKTVVTDAFKSDVSEHGDYGQNEIAINNKTNKNKLHIFFHEALHHITREKIQEFESNPNSKNLKPHEVSAIIDLKRIFKKVTEELNKQEGGFGTQKGGQSPKNMWLLDATGNKRGLANVHEFISEAFTNPEFQKILKDFKGEGKSPTIFKQFLDAVAKMLGLKDATILDDIFHHTEKLTEPKAVEQSLKETPKAETPTNTEEQRLEEIKATKPTVKLELVPTKDLVNSPNPLEAKKAHDEIKDRYKKLKAFLECL